MRMLSVVLVIGALALIGCGSGSGGGSSSATSASAAATSSTAATNASPSHAATVKFLLHAGIAFGAFHRYIYKPLKAGEFKGLLRHKLAVIKATAAAVVVAHELKLASADAKHSPLLSKLTTQLEVLSSGFTAALAKLKAGHFNLLEIESANSAMAAIKNAAGGAGASITESVPAIP